MKPLKTYAGNYVCTSYASTSYAQSPSGVLRAIFSQNVCLRKGRDTILIPNTCLYCVFASDGGKGVSHTDACFLNSTQFFFENHSVASPHSVNITAHCPNFTLLRNFCPRSHPCVCKVCWEFLLSSVLLNGICSIKITLHRNANQEKKSINLQCAR